MNEGKSKEHFKSLKSTILNIKMLIATRRIQEAVITLNSLDLSTLSEQDKNLIINEINEIKSSIVSESVNTIAQNIDESDIAKSKNKEHNLEDSIILARNDLSYLYKLHVKIEKKFKSQEITIFSDTKIKLNERSLGYRDYKESLENAKKSSNIAKKHDDESLEEDFQKILSRNKTLMQSSESIIKASSIGISESSVIDSDLALAKELRILTSEAKIIGSMVQTMIKSAREIEETKQIFVARTKALEEIKSLPRFS